MPIPLFCRPSHVEPVADRFPHPLHRRGFVCEDRRPQRGTGVPPVIKIKKTATPLGKIPMPLFCRHPFPYRTGRRPVSDSPFPCRTSRRPVAAPATYTIQQELAPPPFARQDKPQSQKVNLKARHASAHKPQNVPCACPANTHPCPRVLSLPPSRRAVLRFQNLDF